MEAATSERDNLQTSRRERPDMREEASAALRCGRADFLISRSSVRLADGGLTHRALETDRRDVT